MDLFFIGGIHGAGKSTLCRDIAPLLGAQHVTAGSLILEAMANPAHKVVTNLDQNQQRLIAALDARRAASTAPLLLDGHFCLLDSLGQILNIPLDVFISIAPRKMIVPRGVVYES